MSRPPVEEPRRALTVRTLRQALERLPDEAWVIVNGQGPATMIWTEPHANEPFVLIRRDEPLASTAEAHDD